MSMLPPIMVAQQPDACIHDAVTLQACGSIGNKQENAYCRASV